MFCDFARPLDQFAGVIERLLDNAREALPEGGEVRLSASAEGERVRIEIRDTGAGFTPEALQNACDIRFSTKQGRVVGLGLPISRKVIEAHGGSLDIANAEDGGGLVTILLPSAEDK